ncbi:MAG: DNA-directed RNA polymerase core subunit rpc40 [Marteilia pararefringens]
MSSQIADSFPNSRGLSKTPHLEFGDHIITKSLSIEHPGDYFDENFDFSETKFNDKVTIEIKHYKAREELVFDIKGVDASFVNALRRIMISNVPTVAPEKIHLFQNTSVIQDDVLAHRIGLIPLSCNPDMLQFPPDALEDDVSLTEFNSIQFELNVKCFRDSEGKVINGKVLSNQMKWIPIGNQQTSFSEPVKPIFEDILIAKLVPGQEIAMKIICVKGLGFDHAKFSPVSTAYYRLMPFVKLKQAVFDNEAHQLADLFAEGVIGIDRDKEGKEFAYVKDERLDNGSRNYMMAENLRDKVQSGRISDHFIFCIESVGSLDPVLILEKSLEILSDKCTRWIEKISNNN